MHSLKKSLEGFLSCCLRPSVLGPSWEMKSSQATDLALILCNIYHATSLRKNWNLFDIKKKIEEGCQFNKTFDSDVYKASTRTAAPGRLHWQRNSCSQRISGAGVLPKAAWEALEKVLHCLVTATEQRKEKEWRCWIFPNIVDIFLFLIYILIPEKM